MTRVFLEIIHYGEASTKLCVNLAYYFRSHDWQGTSVHPESMPSAVCAKKGFIGFLPIIIYLLQKMVLQIRCQCDAPIICEEVV